MAEKVLFSLKTALYSETAPLMVESGKLFSDANEKIKISMCLRNRSGRMVSAVLLNILLSDVFGEALETKKYQYLDLNCANLQAFGENVAIEIENSNARSFSVEISAVVYDGNDVVRYDEAIRLAPLGKVTPLPYNDEALAYFRKKNGNQKLAYVPYETDNMWMCACGCWMKTAETAACTSCGAQKGAFDVLPSESDLLSADLNEKILAQREERARREKEEARVKAEAERVRLEEERKQKALLERAAAEKKAKKKKRRRIIGFICFLLILVLIVVGFPFARYVGGAYMNKEGKYAEAEKILSLLSEYQNPVNIEATYFELATAKLGLALECVKAGSYDQAEAYFKEISTQNNYERWGRTQAGYGQAYVNAMRHLSEGNMEAYIAELNKANDYHDTKERIANYKAEEYAKKHQFVQAYYALNDFYGTGEKLNQAIAKQDVRVQYVVDFLAAAKDEGYYFGTYEQDNNKENGEEPILWQMLGNTLNRKTGEVKMLSKYILSAELWNADGSHVTWEKSSLRKKLNNDYKTKFFSGCDSGALSIMTQDNTPSSTLEDYMRTEKNTTEYISLLNLRDAWSLYRSVDASKAEATAYAKSLGATDSYWLRSSEKSTANVHIMPFSKRTSSTATYSMYAPGTLKGVRPVICVNIDMLVQMRYAAEQGQLQLDAGNYAEAEKLFGSAGSVKETELFYAGKMAAITAAAKLENALDRAEKTKIAADQLVTIASRYELAKPEAQKAYYAAAESYKAAGNHEMAAECYLLAGNYTDAVQKSEEMNFALAADYRAKGEYENAIAIYQKLGENEQAQEELLSTVLEYANTFRVKGDYEKAIEICTAVLNNDKTQAEAANISFEYAKSEIKAGNYVKAKELLEGISGQITEAKMLLETDERMVKVAEILKLESLTFGAYEQDGNLDNGAEAIEWIVSDAGNGELRLLSKKILDYKKFNEKNTVYSWKASDLRTFLNNDFYAGAFTDTEKSLILNRLTSNSRKEAQLKGAAGGDILGVTVTFNKTLNGADTNDLVTLLSQCEAVETFVSVEDSKAEITPYARSRYTRANADEIVYYWTRTLLTGDKNGVVLPFTAREAFNVNFAGGSMDLLAGVRPVIYLDANRLTDAVLAMDQAAALLDSGDYQAAYEIYQAADHLTAANYAMAMLAESIENAGSMESMKAAADGFLKAEDFRDAKAKLEKTAQQYAEALLDAGDFEAAHTYFAYAGNSEALTEKKLAATMGYARQLVKDGDYVKAISLLRTVGTDEAKELLSTEKHLVYAQEMISGLSADKILFGAYEQNRSVSDGKERIEWRILKYENGQALLVSEKILAYDKWHRTQSTNNTWESSDLRAWLQNEFANEAFTQMEKASIAAVMNNNTNSRDDMRSEESTEDTVFILSLTEAARFFPGQETKKAEDTASARSTYSGKSNGNWWTRTSYKFDGKVLFMPFGTFNSENSFSFSRNNANVAYGIRPALYLDVNLATAAKFALDDAEECMQNQDYGKAAQLYSMVNSAETAHLLAEAEYGYALQLMEEGEYEKAHEILSALAVNSKAAKVLEECSYQLGKQAFEKGDFDAAIDHFTAAGEFENAKAMYAEAVYLKADALEKADSTAEAKDLFKLISGYKDADERVRKITYDTGKMFLTIGFYHYAVENFRDILGYKDADELLKKYQELGDLEHLHDLHQVGFRTEFGSYVQEGNTATPIQWKILDKDGDYVLMISEKILEYRAFNTDSNGKGWKNSTLRAWLNDEFFHTAFTEEEKAAIAKRTMSGTTTKVDDSLVEEDTEDFVFILNIDEAYEYFTSVKESEAYATSAATSKNNASQKSKYAGTWWTRTVQRSNSDYTAYMPFTKRTETNANFSLVTNNYPGVGVRPVIWLNLRELLPDYE